MTMFSGGPVTEEAAVEAPAPHLVSGVNGQRVSLSEGAEPTRYPLAPLLRAARLTQREACDQWAISGAMWGHYSLHGLSDDQAERLAIRAGFHPFTIWPQMRDDRIDNEKSVCRCGAKFWPKPDRAFQEHCTPACSRRFEVERSVA